eukprot:7379780-Prymnesium_polylepis.1
MPAAWTPPAAADLEAGNRVALRSVGASSVSSHLGDGDVLRGYDIDLDHRLAAEHRADVALAGGTQVPPKHGGETPGRSASERTLRRQGQRDRAAAKAAARSGAGDGAADEPAASEADGDKVHAERQQPQTEPAASEADGSQP